ncbi:ABC transporter permease [bacterium]|nr:ABC transporter permease [bacterium]
MKYIIAIAKNTFRETIRDRLLIGIVALAVFFTVILFYLSDASLGEDRRVLTSVGLGGIYLFGTFITLFLGATLLAKETEKKTLYFVLSRPISRAGMLAGKFFGLLASVSVSILILSLAYFIALYLKVGGFDAESVLAISFQLLESSLLIAIIIFLSIFLRPVLATIAAIVVLYAGHSLTTLVAMAEKINPLLGKLALIFSYIFPNLEKFNIRNDIIYNFTISPPEIIFTILYAIFGTALALLFAAIVFKKKEL